MRDKFMCKETFWIPVQDENGFMTEDYGGIEKDSIWEITEERGESDVRLNLLSGISDFTWIDISFETLQSKLEQLN